MIHGNSTDPVLIKKVYLKVWTLKSEINAIIHQAMKTKGSELTSKETEKLKNEYIKSPILGSSTGLQVLEGGKPSEGDNEEDLEAQMAEALESPDEETSSEGEENEEDLEAQMAAALENPEGTVDAEESNSIQGPQVILQRGSHNLSEKYLSSGATLLSEIEMNQMFFFSNKNFLEGQSIVIEFQVPEKFIVNAEIKYCRPFNLKSRIISKNKLNHRICAEFTFLKVGEKTLLRKFLKAIEPDIPEEVVVPQNVDTDGGGDDFDDLDSLDF